MAGEVPSGLSPIGRDLFFFGFGRLSQHSGCQAQVAINHIGERRQLEPCECVLLAKLRQVLELLVFLLLQQFAYLLSNTANRQKPVLSGCHMDLQLMLWQRTRKGMRMLKIKINRKI